MNSEHRIIDIHAHILPGVDDGARDMDESLAMAKMAYAEGVRAIIATPHRRPEETKDRSGEISERTAGLIGKIREWQQENGLKEPLSLYTGQENACGRTFYRTQLGMCFNIEVISIDAGGNHACYLTSSFRRNDSCRQNYQVSLHENMLAAVDIAGK